MTEKQLKDIFEKMKKIYPYDENEASISIHDLLSYDSRNCVRIETRDKESGIYITMTKYLDEND